MPSSNPVPPLSSEQLTRLCGSLEPAAIKAGLYVVCAEILGRCEVRVFTFVDEDRARVLPFGDEETSQEVAAPALDNPRRFGPEGNPLAVAPPSVDLVQGALLPLEVEGEGIGILHINAERAIDARDLAALSAVSAALAVAVRNARAFEKLRRLTFTDDLTALYNSRFMRLYLDRELKRCRRAKASLSLLFMDLDGFKQVNDTHGHLAGSRTLVEVGALLERTVRDADVLIRYGGDEFVIVFPETPLRGGLVIAEKIRHVIGSTTFLETMGIAARVSASIGIAAYPESADDVRTLISCADRAMYQAKALGKDRVVAASPLTPEPSTRP